MAGNLNKRDNGMPAGLAARQALADRIAQAERQFLADLPALQGAVDEATRQRQAAERAVETHRESERQAAAALTDRRVRHRAARDAAEVELRATASPLIDRALERFTAEQVRCQRLDSSRVETDLDQGRSPRRMLSSTRDNIDARILALVPLIRWLIDEAPLLAVSDDELAGLIDAKWRALPDETKLVDVAVIGGVNASR